MCIFHLKNSKYLGQQKYDLLAIQQKLHLNHTTKNNDDKPRRLRIATRYLGLLKTIKGVGKQKHDILKLQQNTHVLLKTTQRHWKQKHEFLNNKGKCCAC